MYSTTWWSWWWCNWALNPWAHWITYGGTLLQFIVETVDQMILKHLWRYFLAVFETTTSTQSSGISTCHCWSCSIWHSEDTTSLHGVLLSSPTLFNGLAVVDQEVASFQKEHIVFQDEGVCPDGFSLPRQHSMGHYCPLIQDFGAANGLCSSITESKHIKAVKKPWQWTNKHNTIDQILTINEWLDKLAASRQDFRACGMLKGSYWDKVAEDEAKEDEMDGDEDEGLVYGLNIIAEVKLARKGWVST